MKVESLVERRVDGVSGPGTAVVIERLEKTDD